MKIIPIIFSVFLMLVIKPVSASFFHQNTVYKNFDACVNFWNHPDIKYTGELAPANDRVWTKHVLRNGKLVPLYKKGKLVGYKQGKKQYLSKTITYKWLFANAGCYSGLYPGLFAAMARQESKFDSYAKNPKSKATGLLQFMVPAASECYISNRFNVVENVRGASCYMKTKMKQTEGILSLALMSYNQGNGHVERGRFFKEAKDYAPKILHNYMLWLRDNGRPHSL